MVTVIPEVSNFVVGSSVNNTASCLGMVEPEINQRYEVCFWVVAGVFALIIATGTILNSLVIYFSNHQNTLTGKLRYINAVVRHLAVSDLLYGTLACPLLLHRFKMGMISI